MYVRLFGFIGVSGEDVPLSMGVAKEGNTTFSKASDFSRLLEKRPLIHITHCRNWVCLI